MTGKITLVDLIGPESHFLLDVLSTGSDWLVEPVESWPENENYNKELEYVRNIKVLNDIAERGVKMMSDFANIITTDFVVMTYNYSDIVTFVTIFSLIIIMHDTIDTMTQLTHTMLT